MKHWIYVLSFLLFGGLFAGCSENDDVNSDLVGKLEAKVVSTDVNEAKVRLTTENLAKYAYLVKSKAEAATPSVEDLFNATTGSCNESGSTNVTIKNLEADTEYVAYFGGQLTNNTYLTQVVEVSFKTTAQAGEASMSIEVGEVLASQVTVKITSQRLIQYAYLAKKKSEAGTAPSATILFATGKTGTLEDGENNVVVNNLQANTEYVIYFGAITSDEVYYNEVLTVESKTSDFGEMLTVFDVDYDSFKIHAKVPQSVKDGQSALRYMMLDLANYNYLKNIFGRTEYFMLVNNDQIYKMFITDDTTFNYTNDLENMGLEDGNGNIITDEDGYAITTYDPIVPGHQAYFVLGEYSWGKIKWYSYGYNDERDYGWYVPLYDEDGYFMGGGNQDDYWTGYHVRQKIETTPANVQEGQFKVDLSGLKPYGGQIRITPDERCDQYCMFITEEAMLNELYTSVLENNKDLLPWFTTSYSAYNIMYCYTYPAVDDKGNRIDYVANIEDEYYVQQGVKYYIVMNGICNERGTEQAFQIVEFELPSYTKAAPEIVVTAKEATSPYEITFNVKCPTKDAAMVKYLCNYEREWMEAGLNESATLSTYMDSYGSEIEILDYINSDAGYDVTIPSREGAVSYFAAIAYNDEMRASVPAVAHVRSLDEADAERVESSLFEDLKGDWTATATIAYTPTSGTEPVYEELKSKVTIGEIEYEENTPAGTYIYYPKHTTEQVDALYKDLTDAIDLFNTKHRAQNRIICTGFDFYVTASLSSESQLTYQSPYDLFISSTYSGYNGEAVLWDFGPKWYLEVHEDGTVTAPFNMNYFAPLSQWTTTAYWMVAASDAGVLPYMVSADGTEAVNGHFPVTISEDKNTITVNPLTYEIDGTPTKFYPNAPSYSTSGYSLYSRIVSEVKLTRGWEPAATTAKSVNARKQELPTLGNGHSMKPAAKPLSRTKVAQQEQRTVRECTVRMNTPENFRERGDKYMEKLGFVRY